MSLVKVDTVIAEVRNDAVINISGNLNIVANNETSYVGILGGAQAGKQNSIGATVGVLVLNNETVATIGADSEVTVGENVTVDAKAVESIVEVIVNASVAYGAESKLAVAVSPNVNVISSVICIC